MNTKDRNNLRELAKIVKEYSDDPINEIKRKKHISHNKLRQDKPMVLVFPEGSWDELIPDKAYQCEDSLAREIEGELRRRIYYYEHLKDDSPIESTWNVEKKINGFCDFGIRKNRTSSMQKKGSYHIEPVLKDFSDLHGLKMPDVEYDDKVSEVNYKFYQDLFGDILNVNHVGIKFIKFRLMRVYIDLRGYQNMFFDLYDNPQFVHDTVNLLCSTYEKWISDLDKYNLLSLNNDETYNSTGGYGYTDELPQSDYDPNHIKPQNMWACAEVQEFSEVSPEMHYEFALQYEIELLKKFGLAGYGCCEALHDKLDYVFKIPNLRRISIAPWADVKKSAERLKRNYIYSWKPNPAHLAGVFDSDFVKQYILNTLQYTKEHNCNLEMVLKDTHTCNNDPSKFEKWLNIAKELRDQYLSN